MNWSRHWKRQYFLFGPKMRTEVWFAEIPNCSPRTKTDICPAYVMRVNNNSTAAVACTYLNKTNHQKTLSQHTDMKCPSDNA